jgi:small subunit ribosomal protein S19e
VVNAYDVSAGKLIGILADRIKGMPGMEPPEWSKFVKTGSHAERPPQRADWWYTRAASVLRKLYVSGPLGIGDFERAYGGSKAVAYFPKHQRDAGGSIIRRVLKQLEQAELVTKTPKGRVLTPKGTAMLDRVSKELFAAGVQENTALARYG